MCSETKFRLWIVIGVVAIILFIVGAVKGEEAKKEMRPDTYQASRFKPYNKS